MFRMLFVTLVILIASSSIAFAQSADTTTPGRRGTSVLYEASVGRRMNARADGPYGDARVFFSWELGPLFNQGDWAWGATIMASGDNEGPRWGIRPRYKRWLGPNVTLDLGAGLILGGEAGYRPLDPGFAGLVGLSYDASLGVQVELQSIPTTHFSQGCCGSPHERYASGTTTESTAWLWTLGVRTRGLTAVVVSALELFFVMAAVASGPTFTWN